MVLKPILGTENGGKGRQKCLKEQWFYGVVESLRKRIGRGQKSIETVPITRKTEEDSVLVTLQKMNQEEEKKHDSSSEYQSCDDLKRFLQWVPRCLGRVSVTMATTSSRTTTMDYLALENVVASMEQPCILDVKIGVQSFHPEASHEKQGA